MNELTLHVFNPAVTTNILDTLINALVSVFTEVLQKVFSPILLLIWQILVYLPLQIIQAMVTLFNFFANGFSSAIFSSTFDGETWHYQFDLNSGVGQIVMFVLIISLLFFFFYWVYNLGMKKDTIGNKFKQFKWPIYMLFALIAFPLVMVGADTLLSPLLMAFTNTTPMKLSQDDVTKLLKYCAGSEGDFTTLKNIGSNVQISSNTFSAYLSSYITNLENAFSAMKTEMNRTDADPKQFGIIAVHFENLLTSLKKIQTFVNTGLEQDFTKFNSLLHSWDGNIGSGKFLSTEETVIVQKIIDNLNDFTRTFDDLTTLKDKLGDTYCEVGWNSLYQLNEAYTKANLFTPLVNIVNSHEYSVNANKSSISFYVNHEQDSMVSRIIGGCSEYNGLSHIKWCVPTTPPLPVVKVLFVAVTGLPADQWDVSPSLSFIANKLNILNFILGGFACWGMILIIYTFVSSAIKRTYYMLGYWIVGFLYLANGQNDAKAIPSWYKMIFGKWFGILVMYILFNLAGVLVSAIQPAIEEGLKNQSYSLHGINILVSLGLILSVQASYETAYQVSQAYLGAWGAKDEKFSGAEMFTLLKQGQGQLTNTVNSAKSWGSTLSGYSAYNSAKTWNEQRKQQKEKDFQREEQKLAKMKKQGEFAKQKAELRTKGIDTKETTGSALKDFFFTSRVYDNEGKVSGREMNRVGKLFGQQFSGLESNNYRPNFLGIKIMSDEEKAKYRPAVTPPVAGLMGAPVTRANRGVDDDSRNLVAHLNNQMDLSGQMGVADSGAWYQNLRNGPSGNQSRDEWRREVDAYNNIASRINGGNEDTGLSNVTLKKLRQSQGVHEDTGKLHYIDYRQDGDGRELHGDSPLDQVPPAARAQPGGDNSALKYSL